MSLFICHASVDSLSPTPSVRYIASAPMAETARNNVRERHAHDTKTPAQFVLVTCDEAPGNVMRF